MGLIRWAGIRTLTQTLRSTSITYEKAAIKAAFFIILHHARCIIPVRHDRQWQNNLFVSSPNVMHIQVTEFSLHHWCLSRFFTSRHIDAL